MSIFSRLLLSKQHFLLLSFTLFCSQVWGLSMGTPELKSSLGSPLQVMIELGHLGDLTINDLKVGLASNKQYQQMGISRMGFERQLRVKAIQEKTGKTYLSITTRRSFTEPYRPCVVQVRWPSGELLKEISILVDTPQIVQ